MNTTMPDERSAVPAARFSLLSTLALIASLLLVAGCGESGSSASATGAAHVPASPASVTAAPPATPAMPAAAAAAAPFTPSATGPQIELDRLIHDFGAIVDTESYSTTFTVRNVGSEKLRIKDVKAACGCTVPTLARYELDPGGTTELKVTFDPRGKEGPTDKFITVVSTSVEDPSLQLKLTSQIQPLLRFEKIQKLGSLALGKEHKRTLEFYYTDPELEIRSVTTNNPHVQAALIASGVPASSGDGPPAPGAPGASAAQGADEYRADVELTVSADTPWGLLYSARLTLQVSGKPRADKPRTEYTYDAFLSGQIWGELQANPAIISNLSALPTNTPYDGKVTLTRENGAPFTVLSAEITEGAQPGMTVRFDPVETWWTITLSGRTSAIPGDSFRGVVRVRTDVPGEEEIDIRYAGGTKREG